MYTNVSEHKKLMAFGDIPKKCILFNNDLGIYGKPVYKWDGCAKSSQNVYKKYMRDQSYTLKRVIEYMDNRKNYLIPSLFIANVFGAGNAGTIRDIGIAHFVLEKRMRISFIQQIGNYSHMHPYKIYDYVPETVNGDPMNIYEKKFDIVLPPSMVSTYTNV